jgi:hypothetical protein
MYRLLIARPLSSRSQIRKIYRSTSQCRGQIVNCNCKYRNARDLSRYSADERCSCTDRLLKALLLLLDNRSSLSPNLSRSAPPSYCCASVCLLLSLCSFSRPLTLAILASLALLVASLCHVCACDWMQVDPRECEISRRRPTGGPTNRVRHR